MTSLDVAVWDLMVSHRLPLLNTFFVPFSAWSAPRYVFPLLWAVLLLKRARLSTHLPGLIALVLSPILKALIDRPRPPLACQLVAHFDGAMPSGHALMAGVVLALSWRGPRLWRGLVLAWVFLVCVSRLYLGVHWLSDVVVGLFLGAGLGAVPWNRVWRTYPVPYLLNCTQSTKVNDR
ncbi:phosphatase PAP2 family protein [Staphylococcus chromogenes]|nr:phosphatase PAP2 family protein [Staphylococcus chromogenes]